MSTPLTCLKLSFSTSAINGMELSVAGLAVVYGGVVDFCLLGFLTTFILNLGALVTLLNCSALVTLLNSGNFSPNLGFLGFLGGRGGAENTKT